MSKTLRLNYSKLLILLILGCSLFPWHIAIADINSTIGLNQITATNDLPQNKDAVDIIQAVILWMLGVIAVGALAVIIYGGAMYILSLGDEKKAEHAKKIILYAIVGLLIAGGSFVIINTVRDILAPVAAPPAH